MAKKKATAVQPKARGPWAAVCAAVFFVLAAASLVGLFPVEGVEWLTGAVRGVGGGMRFFLPLVFVWMGVLAVNLARGRRVSWLRVLANFLLVLLVFTAVHMFSAEYVDKNGYHVDSALGYGDFVAKSYAFSVGGGALGAILCWPMYSNLGVWGGFALSLGWIFLILLATGRVGKWIRFYREKSQERAQRVNERRADELFEPEEDTLLESAFDAPHTVASTARRRPHEGMPRAGAAAQTRAGVGRAPSARRPAERGEPSNGAPQAAPAKKAAAAAKSTPAKRRMYRETIPGATEETAQQESFGPVVSTASPSISIARGAKKETDSGEKAGISATESVPAEPFKPARAGRLRAQTASASGEIAAVGSSENLRIEPDEYELPDEDVAPFDVPESRKKKPLGKLRRLQEPEEDEEELYNYPPIDLLSHAERPDRAGTEQADLEKAQLLCDTLRSFGIETKLTGIAHGPAVTRFELQPAPGVKVSRITSLSDDIALNLAAERVRIEAPIPGKAAVGVEVPNDKVETVALRDVLESADARRHPSRVAVGLGMDNSGRYIVADIAKMPHVLIAGQTGSGKSVCINSIIVSVLYRATPDEVKLILIDPKVVELSVYNGIPHLIAPVVTDPKKAASALDWAVAEMTQRYKRFAERGVRDIKGYNKALEPGEKRMPQMVIVIDELADLMMVCPGEVEDSICRLAQLARAAGMHLVIATQRPSVNVITGVIKANIPTRIAFSVASQVDSRTMIDHGGAEKLLGNGDMLFVPPGTNKPIRVQGAWVSDDEVHNIVSYIKARTEVTYDEDVVEKIENSVRSDAEREDVEQEYDPKLAEAVEIVVEAGQASVSMLQRRMRVGYARAGRLIDEMEKRGIVSEADGAKPRSVLISREQFIQMFGEELGE